MFELFIIIGVAAGTLHYLIPYVVDTSALFISTGGDVAAVVTALQQTPPAPPEIVLADNTMYDLNDKKATVQFKQLTNHAGSRASLTLSDYFAYTVNGEPRILFSHPNHPPGILSVPTGVVQEMVTHWHNIPAKCHLIATDYPYFSDDNNKSCSKYFIPVNEFGTILGDPFIVKKDKYMGRDLLIEIATFLTHYDALGIKHFLFEYAGMWYALTNGVLDTPPVAFIDWASQNRGLVQMHPFVMTDLHLHYENIRTAALAIHEELQLYATPHTYAQPWLPRIPDLQIEVMPKSYYDIHQLNVRRTVEKCFRFARHLNSLPLESFRK